MMPNEVINPTPAGRKKSPMLSVNNVEILSTCTGFTTLNANAKKSKTIPITLPGMNPSMQLLTNSPTK